MNEQPTSYEVATFEYGTLLDGYHKITDFRHKLLALLPLGSTVAIGILAGVANDAHDARDGIAELIGDYSWTIGVFGLVVTIGLYFFEWKQVDHCIAYIERGKELERQLRFGGGGFFSLEKPERLGGLVGAEAAGVLIYGASAGAWSVVIVLGGAKEPGLTALTLVVVACLARLFQAVARVRAKSKDDHSGHTEVDGACGE